jgi:hypothetical protein
MRPFIIIVSLFAGMATCLLAQPVRAAEPWPDLSNPAAPVGGGEKDAAVIVAVEHYQKLPRIPGAAAVAKSWYAYFTTTRKVPAGKVTLLIDELASSQAIAAAAREAVRSVMAGGRLWFLFIGHAFPEADREDFRLLGWETSPSLESIYALGVSQAQLLSNSGNRSVFLVDASIEGQSTNVEAPRERIAVDQRGLFKPDTLLEKLDYAAKGGDRLFYVAGRFETCELPAVGQPAFSYLLLGALRGWANRGTTAGSQGEREANQLYGVEISQYVADALMAFAPCAPWTWPGYSFVIKEWEGKRRPTETGPDLGAMALRDVEASIAIPVPAPPQPPAPLVHGRLGPPVPAIRAVAEAHGIARAEDDHMQQKLRGTLGAVKTGPYMAADAWMDAAELAPPGRYRDAALERRRLWMAYGKEVHEAGRRASVEWSRLKLVLRSASIAQDEKEALIAAFAKRRGVDAAARVVALAVTGEERVHLCSPYLTATKGQEVVVSATDYEGAGVPVAIFVDGVEVGTGPGKLKLASCASKIRILDRATNESATGKLSPGSARGGIEVKMHRFTVEGDLVIDHENRKTWQRSVSAPLSRAAAARYCAGQNVGGEGWKTQDVYDLRDLHFLDPTTTPFSALGLQTPRYLWTAPEQSAREGIQQVEVPITTPFRFANHSTAPVRCVRFGTTLPKVCDKEALGRLRVEQERICTAIPGRSCDGTKAPAKLLARYPCSAIHKRIEGTQQCLELEKATRVECFGGTPDEKKRASLLRLENEVNACTALAATNCAAGHPMAEK